ncbi:MAG: hypothetical protein NTX36_11085, partial [Proteobacteria bacterium]|nr:hypothetical protein [Pseudomonadota bacterium]
EIAKSKQQRGMLSLYKKYKAQKLSKEQIKQQRKREVKSPSEAVLTVMTDLTEKINKLDIAQLADADKESLHATMTKLKTAINAALKSLAQKPTTTTQKPGI